MTLAVVPIFVNAGAALLPALIAALTSLLALLLSPRALVSLCRRKPWLPALFIAFITALYFSPRLFPSPATVTPPTNNSPDWPAIARNLQQQSKTSILTPLWHHNLDGEAPLSPPALSTDPTTGKPPLSLPPPLFDSGKTFGNLFAIDASPGTGGGGGRQL